MKKVISPLKHIVIIGISPCFPRGFHLRFSALSLLAALVMMWTVSAWAGGEFINLGSIDDSERGAYGGTYARGVSADGNTVVGSSTADDLSDHAFRWTSSDKTMHSNLLPGFGFAYGVSADGSVVVGDGQFRNSEGRLGRHPYRWTEATGPVAISVLPNNVISFAHGVSADGSMVVGMSNNGREFRAFRWSSKDNTVHDLGALPGGTGSQANGASADGSVIVGESENGKGTRAFRWTSSDNTMRDLGVLPGGENSAASGVSADGNVVVGTSGHRAFRWTADDDTMHDLGVPPGSAYSVANGVSADGRVVVGDGMSGDGENMYAFLWTAEGGMQLVSDWLAKAGVELPKDAILTMATGVSADGSVIVGIGKVIVSIGKYGNSNKYFAWRARVSPDEQPR
jgi:probable HAF family extracellular repeat protein